MTKNCPRQRTLDLWPSPGQMLKPRELIDMREAEVLSLHDRRVYNALVANAWGPDLGRPETEFVIAMEVLRGANHQSNDRVIASIETLMRTIVRITLEDGTVRRVQLLGGNDMSEPTRQLGFLRYTFDRRLAVILRDSTMFGVLQKDVMRALGSKHALTLYEALCRRVPLKHVFMEELDLEDLRCLLGVEKGKLGRYADLRRFAIEPAVREIETYAPFSCRIDPIKGGRRVVGARLAWWHKGAEDYRAALRALSLRLPDRAPLSASGLPT